MILTKGTLVREASITEPMILERDISGPVVLQTDLRVWVRCEDTGKVYIFDFDQNHGDSSMGEPV
jgi:hypothetical protein